MVTFAPVTIAPEESTTVPARLPRTDDSADPWANAGTVKAVSRASTAKPTTNFLAIICHSLCCLLLVLVWYENSIPGLAAALAINRTLRLISGERNPTLLKHRWCQHQLDSSQADTLFSAT